MFENYKRRRATKNYLRLLPLALAKRYGVGDYYTSGQICQTVEQLKLSITYINIAKVLFMLPKEAETDISSSETYAGIVGELSSKYFGGDEKFNHTSLKKRNAGNIGHSSLGPTIEAFHD